MSEWYQIESNSLIVQVASHGAEMKRLFSKEWHRELLWAGDEKSWNCSAPVLFPIVGKIKDDEYFFKEKKFHMKQHGFARDQEFKCTECKASEVEFSLVATSETFKSYPFLFELKVRYKVEKHKVTISYFVKNDDRQDMFFSIGAHPAFETKNFTNYELHFEKIEKEYFRVDKNGLDLKKAHVLKSDVIKISKNLFKEDALVFEKLKSKYIDLVDTKRKETIRIHGHAPYWGVWGKGDVPFVSLEPWHGIPDLNDHEKNIENKKAIIALQEGEIFGFSYAIEMKNTIEKK